MRSTFARLATLVLVATACGSTPSPASEPKSALGVAQVDPEYDRLCRAVPPELQAKCPMGAWAQSIDDIDGGVLLHLNASAPPPDLTQKQMRCHRAWMAHDPSNAMPRCPLGSPGITITATAGGTGTDLSMVASKPEDVQEIRRRSHAALGR